MKIGNKTNDEYFSFDLFFNFSKDVSTSLYSINYIYFYIKSSNISFNDLKYKIKKKKIKLISSDKYVCLFDVNDKNKIILLEKDKDFQYYLYTDKKNEKRYFVYNNNIYEQLSDISNILSLILKNDFNNNTFEFLDFILKQEYLKFVSDSKFLFDDVLFVRFNIDNVKHLNYIIENNKKILEIANTFLELKYSMYNMNIRNKLCSYFIKRIDNNDYCIDDDKLIYELPIYPHNFIPIKCNITDFLKYLVLRYKIMNI